VSSSGCRCEAGAVDVVVDVAVEGAGAPAVVRVRLGLVGGGERNEGGTRRRRKLEKSSTR
jgi:hypothetical protein